MAKKTAQSGDLPYKVKKSIKGEMPEWAELKEDSHVIGFYEGFKMLTIKDQETGEDKDVRVYTFTDITDPDKKFAISGRTLLDVAFDTASKQSDLSGELLAIRRLKDTKNGKKRIGNYMIDILEVPDEE